MGASIDWQHEWSASLLWSGTALAGVVAVLALVIWLLTRFTGWGRQLRHLAAPYFRPSRSWVSAFIIHW